jgi:hypothetical protein
MCDPLCCAGGLLLLQCVLSAYLNVDALGFSVVSTINGDLHNTQQHSVGVIPATCHDAAGTRAGRTVVEQALHLQESCQVHQE